MNHETEFGLKQAKKSRANGSSILSNQWLNLNGPALEEGTGRDPTFLTRGNGYPYAGKPNGNGRVAHWLKSLPSVREIDFAELDDGSLVELVEDPKDPNHTLLAVYKDGDISYTDELKYRDQILLPVQRAAGLSKHVRLPRGARPYKSVQTLLGRVEQLIARCVDLPQEYVAVLASFVLSTWLVDQLPVAPYVSIVGLPQSGKTTLLSVLSLVCRRSLFTADITSAAFYDACSQFMPTLLIDEAGTHVRNGRLRHLLRIGTTRGVVAVQRNRSFHAYGAKVVCFLELPDDPALNSRCVQIPMLEATGSNLLEPTDPIVEKHAAELQKSLLQFRFNAYKQIRPAAVPGAERLRPRTRDLLTCLAAPSSDDSARCHLLLRFFEFQNVAAQEPLLPAQDAILAALFLSLHSREESPDSTVLRVQDLTSLVNSLLESLGESFRLSPRKVGSVLTSLGFLARQRTNKGWVLWLSRSDRQRIHELAKTYGIDNSTTEHLKISTEDCPRCQETSGLLDDAVLARRHLEESRRERRERRARSRRSGLIAG